MSSTPFIFHYQEVMSLTTDHCTVTGEWQQLPQSPAPLPLHRVARPRGAGQHRVPDSVRQDGPGLRGPLAVHRRHCGALQVREGKSRRTSRRGSGRRTRRRSRMKEVTEEIRKGFRGGGQGGGSGGGSGEGATSCRVAAAHTDLCVCVCAYVSVLVWAALGPSWLWTGFCSSWTPREPSTSTAVCLTFGCTASTWSRQR